MRAALIRASFILLVYTARMRAALIRASFILLVYTARMRAALIRASFIHEGCPHTSDSYCSYEGCPHTSDSYCTYEGCRSYPRSYSIHIHARIRFIYCPYIVARIRAVARIRCILPVYSSMRTHIVVCGRIRATGACWVGVYYVFGVCVYL
jgi:hypothetical protein